MNSNYNIRDNKPVNPLVVVINKLQNNNVLQSLIQLEKILHDTFKIMVTRDFKIGNNFTQPLAVIYDQCNGVYRNLYNNQFELNMNIFSIQ